MRKRCFSYINPQFFAKLILPNGSCYVSRSSPLPSFYSDYSRKLAINFCFQRVRRKKLLTQDYFVSTHNFLYSLENCKFHWVLIGTSFSQTLQRLDKYIFMKKLTVFTLFSKTDSIQVKLHQAEKYSTSLV